MTATATEERFRLSEVGENLLAGFPFVNCPTFTVKIFKKNFFAYWLKNIRFAKPI